MLNLPYSVHPFESLLASTSGQRHFILDDSDSDSMETDVCPNEYREENSLRIWRM